MQESDQNACVSNFQRQSTDEMPPEISPTNDSYRSAYRSARVRNMPTLEQLIAPLAQNFATMIESNFNKEACLSPFNSKRAPSISVRDYLARLARFSRCSPESFLIAVIYIDRYIQERPDEIINSLNFHKLNNKTLPYFSGERVQIQRRSHVEQ